MVGHDLTLQGGGRVDDGLICTHCTLILRDAIQTSETGLRFCKDCFEEAAKCPTSGIDPNEVPWNDRAVHKEIDLLRVVCRAGCAWEGLLKNYLDHSHQCECTTSTITTGVHVQATALSSTPPTGTEQLNLNNGNRFLCTSLQSVESLQPAMACTTYQSPPLPLDKLVSDLSIRLEEIEQTVADHSSRITEFMAWKKEQELSEPNKSNTVTIPASQYENLVLNSSGNRNGKLMWPVTNVSRLAKAAQGGIDPNIYSLPFYTGQYGYKMCITAYLNGNGMGKGTHLSLFLVLMRGEYDPLLQWPFEAQVSLTLVDQDHRKHMVQTFKPNPQSSSFQKPKTDMNVASGCPKFAELSILDNPSYVKEDVMFIKAIVDTDNPPLI